jgi:hypothetical protein
MTHQVSRAMSAPFGHDRPQFRIDRDPIEGWVGERFDNPAPDAIGAPQRRISWSRRDRVLRSVGARR